MPILECILIDGTTNQNKFTTNDMELGIETIVDGIIEEKGIIALDADVYKRQLLTFSFCLLLFYNCSFYSFKNRRRRFFDFYLPMQNLLNISDVYKRQPCAYGAST